MLKLERTTAQNSVFRSLVSELDAFLKVTDGDDHDFYNQYNQLDDIKHAIIIYIDDEPVGCGAIKLLDKQVYEVKRMYTKESHRGKGLATKILKELESWSKELNGKKCILETGIRQTSAVALYRKCGYIKVPNYGQYEGVEDSLCFEKKL